MAQYDPLVGRKSGPASIKEINGRTVTGYFAIHGNRDHGGDRSHPGAFAAAFANLRHCRYLWQHDGDAPPIATINGVGEVGAADLPDVILQQAPDATGAAWVTRTYLDTARGNEALAGVTAGAIVEQSYMYRVGEWRDSYDDADDIYTRELYSFSAIYDISDVNWGMNPATSAAGKGRGRSLSLADQAAAAQAAARDLVDRMHDLKQLRERDHRTLSKVNIDRLHGIKQEIAALTETLDALLTHPEAAAAKASDQDVRRELARFEYLRAVAMQTR